MTSSDGQWVWRKASFSQGSGNSDCVEVGCWRKSSFSQGNTNSDCVEVAWTSPVTAVRDSKSPDSGMLTIPESSWRLFRLSVSSDQAAQV
jgi:hypothetical protein